MTDFRSSPEDGLFSAAALRLWSTMWAGHVNRDSGYGRWPEALALADELEVAAYGSPASATT